MRDDEFREALGNEHRARDVNVRVDEGGKKRLPLEVHGLTRLTDAFGHHRRDEAVLDQNVDALHELARVDVGDDAPRKARVRGDGEVRGVDAAAERVEVGGGEGDGDGGGGVGMRRGGHVGGVLRDGEDKLPT